LVGYDGSDAFSSGKAFMRRTATALSLAILIIAADSRADVVELRGGGQIEGAVKRNAQEKAPYAVVQVDPALRIAIPESQIARVAASADLEEYSEKVKATPDDADAQYELARWCKGKTLLAQYRHHLQRAIAVDPDHAKARAALGFVDHEGKWIRYSQLQKERGLIPVAGRYRLPEEVALLDARSESEIDTKRWTREISRLRAAVLRGGDKGAAASAALAAIQDPYAAPAMAAELVENVKQPQTLRLFWIERLYVFANRPALEALAKVGLNDPDSVVREKALEVLAKIAPGSAIATYAPMLKSNDNALVNRAANALTYFPDPEMALTLVEALVTEHKKEIPADQSTTVGFGGGGGGLSSGGKAKIVVTQLQNPPVLAALRAIVPDADFGYDESQWRQYFARQLSSYSGDMRRDP
jgi:hypothetical protein